MTILIGQNIVDCHLYLQHCKSVHGIWPEWEHVADTHAWGRRHHRLGGRYHRSTGSRLLSQWLRTGINNHTHQTECPKYTCCLHMCVAAVNTAQRLPCDKTTGVCFAASFIPGRSQIKKKNGLASTVCACVTIPRKFRYNLGHLKMVCIICIRQSVSFLFASGLGARLI